MSNHNMKTAIEALLIATDIPLTLKRIIEITNLSEDAIRKYIDELNQEYRISERSFEIKEIAGGFQIYTLPVFADWVSALHEHKSRLSKAALETLAIIAYHQPITRPEIEKLRGVDSTWIIYTLLQKGLVKTSGRLPVPGRPIKYATTKEFLRYFGIKDLNDLPREEDFGERVASSIGEEIPHEPDALSPGEKTSETNDETVEDEKDKGFDEITDSISADDQN